MYNFLTKYFILDSLICGKHTGITTFQNLVFFFFCIFICSRIFPAINRANYMQNTSIMLVFQASKSPQKSPLLPYTMRFGYVFIQEGASLLAGWRARRWQSGSKKGVRGIWITASVYL